MRPSGTIQLLLYRSRLLLQLGRLLLHLSHLGLGGLGLLFAALAHQHTDLLGSLVLGGQRVVKLGLDGTTTVVEGDNLLDDGCCIDTLLGQTANCLGLVVAYLLDSKHISRNLSCVFGLQSTKLQNNSQK